MRKIAFWRPRPRSRCYGAAVIRVLDGAVFCGGRLTDRVCVTGGFTDRFLRHGRFDGQAFDGGSLTEFSSGSMEGSWFLLCCCVRGKMHRVRAFSEYI